MKNDFKYAGFWKRLLAHFIDTGLYLVLFSLALLWTFQANTLTDFTYRLFLFFVTVILPFIVVGLLYSALFTHFLGATIGKIVTGLRIVDKNGKYLNKKRSFFRNSIGYQFSGMFFGLGYLAIIKDPESQAWHDKTVGSWVIIKQRLWPLALLILILLIFINGYIINTAFGYLTHGPLKDEFSYLYISTQHQIDAEKNQPRINQPLNNIKIYDATPSTKSSVLK